jgi:hypothetical protein
MADIIPKKEPAINKYSIYEMKNAIDTKIVDFLEKNGFKEDHTHSNLKIFVGLFCLVFTALAYFYPLPFPENYNVIALSVAMYAIGSAVYYYVEKYVIKQSFYTGFSNSYTQDVRKGRNVPIKNIRISSDIKDHSHQYNFWVEFITKTGDSVIPEKIVLDCTKLCDEKGYVIKNLVHTIFKEKFNELLSHKLD